MSTTPPPDDSGPFRESGAVQIGSTAATGPILGRHGDQVGCLAGLVADLADALEDRDRARTVQTLRAVRGHTLELLAAAGEPDAQAELDAQVRAQVEGTGTVWADTEAELRSTLNRGWRLLGNLKRLREEGGSR